MKSLTYALSAVALLAMLVAGDAVAAKGGGKKPAKPQPTRIRATLTIDPALADLTTASAKVDYDAKRHRSLKGLVRLPVASTSLGIVDAATAAAAEVHLEFAREGAVFADCTLRFQAPKEGEVPSAWQYRLHVKTNGKKEVHGTCGAGAIPTLQTGDTMKAYRLLAGARQDFASK